METFVAARFKTMATSTWGTQLELWLSGSGTQLLPFKKWSHSASGAPAEQHGSKLSCEGPEQVSPSPREGEKTVREAEEKLLAFPEG